MLLKKERENGLLKKSAGWGQWLHWRLRRCLVTRECFCLLGSDNCSTGLGVGCETGSNGVFQKMDLPVELMKDNEKIEENGAQPDRRDVEVSWSLK